MGKTKQRAEEPLKRLTVLLEEEVIDALKELSRDFERETGKRWSKGAVIRLALSEFFTRRGKML